VSLKTRSSEDQRIADALTLLEDVERVEFKLTVRDTEQASAVEALDLDVLDAELRHVVFFDTPDLRLNRAGVVVRARRIRKGGDTTVKLRPVIVGALPGKLRRSSGFSVELDVTPVALVSSGSLTEEVDNDDVKAVLRGTRPIRKLFRPKQRSFYAQHAPRALDLDALVAFGPVNVAKLKFVPRKFKGREGAAELWFYPDGSRLLEISTKCPRDDAFQLLTECRALLARHGISHEGPQETKTRKALDYFSKLHARAS
jgi:hypothetical protein